MILLIPIQQHRVYFYHLPFHFGNPFSNSEKPGSHYLQYIYLFAYFYSTHSLDIINLPISV